MLDLESKLGDGTASELDDGPAAKPSRAYECDNMSDADTSSGTLDADMFDPQVDEAYVATLTILKVKTCPGCLHSSNELNPLVCGAFARSRKHPCRPWAQGEFSKPRSKHCRLCVHAFWLGGYDVEHKSLEKLVEVMRTHDTLTDEFNASVTDLIDAINKGLVTLRLRGSKKAKLQELMQQNRKKVVEMIKKEGVNCKVPFKAIELDTYLERHPTASRADLLIKKLPIPGVGPRECVLLRKCPVGEYDVEMEASLSSVIREEVDAGSVRLREGQEIQKQEHLARQITGNATKKQADNVIDLASYENKYMRPSSRSSQPAVAPPGALPRMMSTDPSDSDGDDSSDGDGPNNTSHDFAGTLLDGFMAPTPRPPAAAARACPPPKSNKHVAAAKAQSAQLTAPATGGLGDAHEKRKGGGKGKAARIPTGVSGLLQHEGVGKLEAEFTAMKAQFTKAPFSETNTFSLATSKQFETIRKDMASKLDKIIKDVQVVEARLERRTWTPRDAMDTLQELRLTAKAVHSLLAEVSKNDFDPARAIPFLEKATASGVDVGYLVRVKIYCQRLKDWVRFGKWDELRLHLLQDKGFPSTCLEELHDNILETELQKMIQKMPANPKSDLASQALGKFHSLLCVMEPHVSPAASEAVGKFKGAVDSSAPGHLGSNAQASTPKLRLVRPMLTCISKCFVCLYTVLYLLSSSLAPHLLKDLAR